VAASTIIRPKARCLARGGGYKVDPSSVCAWRGRVKENFGSGLTRKKEEVATERVFVRTTKRTATWTKSEKKKLKTEELSREGNYLRERSISCNTKCGSEISSIGRGTTRTERRG